MTKPLKVYDFVSVTIKHVEYFGHIVDIDYDSRVLSACIEFFPGCERWFDLSDIRRFGFPKPS